MPNKLLPEELHQLIIRKVKRKLYSTFKDNIWDGGFVNMQSISKYDKGFRFLLSAFDIFSKYACVFLLKDKKGITITNTFGKALYESNRYLDKI